MIGDRHLTYPLRKVAMDSKVYTQYTSNEWDKVVQATVRVFGTDWIKFDELLEGLGSHGAMKPILYEQFVFRPNPFHIIQGLLVVEYAKA